MSKLDILRKHFEDEAGGAGDRAPNATGGARAEASPRLDRDSEMAEMLSEVDLLSMIQADAGEAGRKTADRIDFRKCPVCGHRDCFSYYPNTNSWSCFGASNSTCYAGGSALEYYKATRSDDDVEAVTWLRDQTGHPYRKDDERADGETQDESRRILPPWVPVRASDPPARSPVLIDGLLRFGHVGLLAGKGKAGKSWAAIQLSVAVATGGEWFGRKCAQGGVLYLDPEIDPRSFHNRVSSVCEAMETDPAEVDKHVRLWSLRGVPAHMDSIVHDVRLFAERGAFALIVIDSASVFVEGDENSSTDVRKFTGKVLQVASATGAGVLLVHHYGKGDAGDRATADRARGSSVWLDFPEVALFMTELLPPSGEVGDYLDEGERAFLLEVGGIREFPAPDDARLIYGYPVHRIDGEGITADWKPASAQSRGGKQKASVAKAENDAKAAQAEAALMAHFYSERIGSEGVTLKEAAQIVGVDSRTLESRLNGGDHFEIVATSPRKRFVRAKVAPRPVQSETGI